MQGDLSNLAAVKAYLGFTDTGSDALLGRMLTSASRMVSNYCQRPGFAAQAFTEIYDGWGKSSLVLRRAPIIAVASINFCGTSITALATGNPPSNGYKVLDNGSQQTLQLYGYCFPRAQAAIEVNYTAGFQRADTLTIPATPFQLKPGDLSGFTWIADGGVTYNGAAFVAVASGPAAGQYAVDAVTGQYTFAAADAGKAVVITYSYVPSDVEQAVKETVAERFKYKDRVGQVSKSMGGGVNETVTFSTKDLNDFTKTLLANYIMVAPA